MIFLLLVSCSRSDNEELVLAQFDKSFFLTPTDSILLDPHEIYSPGYIYYVNDLFVFKNRPLKNHITVFDFKSKAKYEQVDLGQGPNEAVNLSMIHTTNKNKVVYYNMTQQKVQSFDVDSLLTDNASPTYEYNLKTNDKLTKIIETDSFYIGTGILRDKRYMVVTKNNNNISYQLDYPEIEEFVALNQIQKGAVFSGSRLVPKPDNNKFAFFLNGLMEIYSIEKEGKISLQMKNYTYSPKILHAEEKSGPLLTYSRENVVGYSSVDADDNYIYVLYSDKSEATKIEQEAWYCPYLLVYDWDGNPVRFYELSKYIYDLSVDNGVIYGLHESDESIVYIYNIEI